MLFYRTFSDYLSAIFPGKVRKIAVNASLGCPNRDGTVGYGGCTYCNNSSFSPGYAKGDVRRQIERGKKFNGNKGAPSGYLAYFQSFTGTYGPLDRLKELYEEALSCPDVVGLVIATRPDCIPQELLDYFRQRFGKDAPPGHPHLLVELGIESTCNRTLSAINRGHSWECSKLCAVKLDEAGIDVGAHLVIGLPGEKRNDFLRHAKLVSTLPVKTLKLHQLQLIKGTAMAADYALHPEKFHPLSPQEYAGIVLEMLHLLRPDIALDRFVSESPKNMVIAPSWGLKPCEFANLLQQMESERERCDALLFGTMGNLGQCAAKALEKHGLNVKSVEFPQNTYKDRAGYERELLRAVRLYSPKVVIPVGHPLALAELRDKLPLKTRAAVADTALIRLLDSKVRVYELARRIGIPQPALQGAPEKIRSFPVIFKLDKSFGGSGVYKPFSAQALKNLMDRHKGEDYLIEEYIEGQDYSVDCFADGAEFSFSCYRCVSNQGQGPSISRECVDFPELGQYAEKILRNIGYEGVCGMDFRVDRSGKAFFLECNPRLCGGLQTQIEAGFDLPWMLFQKNCLNQEPDSSSQRSSPCFPAAAHTQPMYRLPNPISDGSSEASASSIPNRISRQRILPTTNSTTSGSTALSPTAAFLSDA